MFSTLTQIMLIVLIGVIVWQALLKGTGKDAKPRDYVAWFGLALILFFLILSLITPNAPVVITFGSILTFPLKPLGLAILLLFFGLGEIKRKGNSITNNGINKIWAAFLILTIFSLPLVANLLAQRVQQDVIAGYQAALGRHETVGAIVLLAHSATQLSLLAPNQLQLNDPSDRILQTVQEYDRQLYLDREDSPKIIVSAGPKVGFESYSKSNRPEADKIAATLESLGIPSEDILRERTGVDVHSSAEAIKKQYVDSRKISKRVILVTSALNMQRARHTFAQLGIDTIPSPAGFYNLQADSTPKVQVRTSQKGACDTLSISIQNARKTRISDLIPSPEGLLISTRVINEFWTSVYYFLRGWLAPTVQPVPQYKDVGC